MLTNYFKIAWRQLAKDRQFTLLANRFYVSH